MWEDVPVKYVSVSPTQTIPNTHRCGSTLECHQTLLLQLKFDQLRKVSLLAANVSQPGLDLSW